jgi:hypothetical protein
MGVQFRLDGLAELQEELRQLPAQLTGEAQKIVEAEANAAAVAIRRVYADHVVSGRLLRGVEVVLESKSFGVVYKVVSRSPIAWLFDNGSQARHWATRGGRSTGTMWGQTPPTHVFVRTMMAARVKMWKALALLLTRHGLKVSGDGAA